MMDDVQEVGTAISTAPAPPSPTLEQLARAAALRSFNRRVLYLPLGLITFFWAFLLLVMLWLALFSSRFAADITETYFRALFSGVADLVLTGLFAFWLLLGMIPIGITAFIWWKMRERRVNRPPGPDPLPIMWRLENVVIMVSERVAAFLPLLARPLVLLYGISSYVRTLLLEIKKIITRS